MIFINTVEEMEEYYKPDMNAYVFKGDVTFMCDVSVKSHIFARNITARNINAMDINARNISAKNITYDEVCFTYKDITCESIKGRRNNARHFVLNGKLKVEKK